MHRFRVLLWVVPFLLMALPGAVQAQTPPIQTQAPACQFNLGFKALHDALPVTVGQCLGNERYNANGDSTQPTTNGLLVWRKADNWTGFTNGYQTWINGPNGLVTRLNTQRYCWEAGSTPATCLQEQQRVRQQDQQRLQDGSGS